MLPRALHRLDVTPPTRRDGLDRRERLSINHKHAHVRDRLLIRVDVRLQFIIRVGPAASARGFDRRGFH